MRRYAGISVVLHALLLTVMIVGLPAPDAPPEEVEVTMSVDAAGPPQKAIKAKKPADVPAPADTAQPSPELQPAPEPP